MEEELLTTLSRLSNVIGGFVTTVLIPVAGYWGYREYNKRKAGAERTISRNMPPNGKSYTKRKSNVSANWIPRSMPFMTK